MSMFFRDLGKQSLSLPFRAVLSSPSVRGTPFDKLTIPSQDGKRRNKITQKGELRVKRTLISLLVSTAMVIGPLPAMSADTGPLPSGTAAGVKQAQADNDPPLLWLVGAGVVIGIGILILANNNDNNGGTAAATTTAATTTTKAVTTTTTNP
jgi:hypothetical protein